MQMLIINYSVFSQFSEHNCVPNSQSWSFSFGCRCFLPLLRGISNGLSSASGAEPGPSALDQSPSEVGDPRGATLRLGDFGATLPGARLSPSADTQRRGPSGQTPPGRAQRAVGTCERAGFGSRRGR